MHVQREPAGRDQACVLYVYVCACVYDCKWQDTKTSEDSIVDLAQWAILKCNIFLFPPRPFFLALFCFL